MATGLCYSAVIVMLICTLTRVYGHGRLWEPPSRGSMWRRGYNTSININDNELSCGGFTNQWVTYGGRCGVCGDRYEQQPRDHEFGGKFASGTITRVYPIGGKIDVVVGLTANHGGYFEFKLCPISDPGYPATEVCLDRHPLSILNGDDGGKKFFIKDHTVERHVEVTVLLPPNLNCKHCVFRWRYRTGSRWGCDGRKCGKGYGPQEEFYGCSDISIGHVKSTVYFDPVLSENSTHPSMGLNDLGASKSDWGKRRNSNNTYTSTTHPGGVHFIGYKYKNKKDQRNHKSGISSIVLSQFPKPLSKTHLFSGRVIKKTRKPSTRSRSRFVSPVLAEAQMKKSQVTRTSIVKPIEYTPVVSTPSRSVQANMKAARQFLEDITFNAIVNYYRKDKNMPTGLKCKASIRYQRNPIVQHYCSSNCVSDNIKCPALLCNCRVSSEQIRPNTKRFTQLIKPPRINTKKSKTLPTTTVTNIGYLKTFVRNLIDKNNLLEDKESKFAKLTTTRHTKSLPTHNGRYEPLRVSSHVPESKALKKESTPRFGRIRFAEYAQPTASTSFSVPDRSTESYGGQHILPRQTLKNTIATPRTYILKRRNNNRLSHNEIGTSKPTGKQIQPRLLKSINRLPNPRRTSIPSITLFNIPNTTSNRNMFKSSVKSTIKKTDKAQTKRIPNSKVLPKVMRCTASEKFAHNPSMTKWCTANCPFGFCPTDVCSCNNRPA